MYYLSSVYFVNDQVWNLVVDTAGGKEAEGVWERPVEENIWTYVYAMQLESKKGRTRDFYETVPEIKLFLYFSDQICLDFTKSQK